MFRKTLPNGITLHDVTLWMNGLDSGFADVKSGAAYTASNMTKGANIHNGTELIFNGTNGKISCGAIGNINTVTFWIKPTSEDEPLFDLDGTSSISVVDGVVTTTSITGTTIYVDGQAETLLHASGTWDFVVVTFTTAVNASAFVMGLVGSDYLAGSLTNILCFSKVVTATQVGQIMEYVKTGEPGSNNLYDDSDVFVYDDSDLEVVI